MHAFRNRKHLDFSFLDILVSLSHVSPSLPLSLFLASSHYLLPFVNESKERKKKVEKCECLKLYPVLKQGRKMMDDEVAEKEREEDPLTLFFIPASYFHPFFLFLSISYNT